MSSTTDSYVTQITALAQSFKTPCAAAALFYWDDNHKHGLRVEATTIMKEFKDNVNFGRDPEGILFYNATSDFDDDGDVPYKVLYNSEDPKAIRIDFYPLGATQDASTRFASFLTKDTNSIETSCLADGTGNWNDLKIGTSFAKMHKITTSSTVTLQMQPINKQASFTLSDNTDKKAIDITGVFHYDLLSDLTGSSTANYDSDRLLFYPTNDKDTLTGVFFANDPIPIDDTHDSNPPTATWSNLN
jgi:hypothetical protein